MSLLNDEPVFGRQRELIPMTKDQSYVAEQFKSSYNRLFSEFQKQVLIEYAAIKADYI